MRRNPGVMLLMVLGGGVLASPVPPGGPSAKNPKALHEEAQRYAQQMSLFTDQLVMHYFRPLQREDLLEAAILGLYQAARQAPPRNLKSQLREAVSRSVMLRTQALQQAQQHVADRPRQDPVEQLLLQVREELGDQLNQAGQPAALLSARAISRLLDPHSGVVSVEEQRRNIGMDHDCVGVGVVFKELQATDVLEIETVYPGGPAQRVGLKTGDRITRIDDQPIAQAPPDKILALRGTPPFDDIPNLASPHTGMNKPAELSRVIKVHYRRPGESEEREITLLRERYRPETVQGVRRRADNSWDWLIDESSGLAHVRITNLSRGTADDLRAVVFALTRQPKFKGLLLDLRWCPGGYLNEAVEVADLFLGTCVIATIKNRGREDTVYRSTSEAKPGDFPLVVLVNSETSGGAELIAAALQDHQRAIVVGQRTLGKASVQTPLSIGLEGFGFKLTSGTFVRPGGKNLHRFPESGADDDWGVIPDVDARLSSELGKRLKSWWQQQALRSPRSTERLPLDDPRADPQQQMALQILKKRVK